MSKIDKKVESDMLNALCSTFGENISYYAMITYVNDNYGSDAAIEKLFDTIHKLKNPIGPKFDPRTDPLSIHTITVSNFLSKLINKINYFKFDGESKYLDNIDKHKTKDDKIRDIKVASLNLVLNIIKVIIWRQSRFIYNNLTATKNELKIEKELFTTWTQCDIHDGVIANIAIAYFRTSLMNDIDIINKNGDFNDISEKKLIGYANSLNNIFIESYNQKRDLYRVRHFLDGLLICFTGYCPKQCFNILMNLIESKSPREKIVIITNFARNNIEYFADAISIALPLMLKMLQKNICKLCELFADKIDVDMFYHNVLCFYDSLGGYNNENRLHTLAMLLRLFINKYCKDENSHFAKITHIFMILRENDYCKKSTRNILRFYLAIRGTKFKRVEIFTLINDVLRSVVHNKFSFEELDTIQLTTLNKKFPRSMKAICIGIYDSLREKSPKPKEFVNRNDNIYLKWALSSIPSLRKYALGQYIVDIKKSTGAKEELNCVLCLGKTRKIFIHCEHSVCESCVILKLEESIFSPYRVCTSCAYFTRSDSDDEEEEEDENGDEEEEEE